VKPATVLIGFVLVIFLVVVSKAEGAPIPPRPTQAASATRTSAPTPAPDVVPVSNPLSATGRFADAAAIAASVVAMVLAALAVLALRRR